MASTKSEQEIEIEVLKELVILIGKHLPENTKELIANKQREKIIKQEEFEELVKKDEKNIEKIGLERQVRIRYLLSTKD